jgi:hypothetical protein
VLQEVMQVLVEVEEVVRGALLELLLEVQVLVMVVEEGRLH